jgi:hypothetical protein
LSLGQEALWLLYNLAPTSAAYNDAGAAMLTPVPNVDALADAVRLTAQRHDILRSVFTEADGVPGRQVRGAGTVDLDVRDASALDDVQLAHAARDVAVTPFVLDTEGPLRVVLLRRENDAALVIGDHHIATDAVSQWLIWRDVLHAYRAFATGRHPDLAPIDGTYDDYVARERRLLESPVRARMEDYWRGVCAGATAAELPTDRPRPPQQTFTGATYSRRLSPELVAGITETAARLSVTPFSLLLGAFQALVYRYTLQEDFLLGCPTTTRRSRSTRDVVGYFVNTLMLRAQLGRDSTFADVIQAAGRQVVRGTANVGYPFPLLLKTLGRSATSGAPPLFRIAFTMVAASRFDATLDQVADGRADTRDAGLRITPLEVPRLEGQFDLNVDITRSTSSMTAVFRYNTALFDSETIERLVGGFVRFLGQAVGNPSSRIVRAPLMDDSERSRLLMMGAGAVGPQ